MERKITIRNERYKIPAVFTHPDAKGKYPAVILCHGTCSDKDEAGSLFVALAEALLQNGIASIRFDFAGCGESTAQPQDFTFSGEVRDIEKVYARLCREKLIDRHKIAVLGFSQGARAMAVFLGKHPGKINAAVSWSGICHNGKGVFARWFTDYYDDAARDGYVSIPMGWREDLILPKQWFDDIRGTFPMDSLSKYTGAMLAVAGTKDVLTPYVHAIDIANACGGKVCEVRIIDGADHTLNVLRKDHSTAVQVVIETADWLAVNIQGEKQGEK
ncbi:MAG: alpha/beta fold hydrolase [Eubacteriales bacterium]|nr:alpha/beta fold hydrolase [Eubacteriales bacterium]MDD4444955.1 alpha/beta fold hydrolase [Eubacteriales bacterium]